MTQPPPPPEDGWPTADEPTVVRSREEVVADPVGPPPGPPPDRRIGAGMLLALGALALVAAGLLIAWFLTHRDDKKKTTTVVVTTQPATTVATKVAVPRLIGLKEQEALVRLGQLGLRPKEVYKATAKPTRLVVSQSPAEATRLAKGSSVTLVIDSGAPKVAVPDLTGQSFAAAQAKLDAAGLDSAKTEVTSPGDAAGTVVDQAPKPGAKAAKGSVVTLSVAKAAPTTTASTPSTTTPATTTSSTGTTTTSGTTTTGTTTRAAPTPKNATMPDVQGQQEQAAVTTLSRAGVLASLVFVPGSDPLGTVVQQAKPSGTVVPYLSHVQVNVSRGPGTKVDESVPNVVGQTLTQAVASMNGAHLRLIYVKYPVTSKSQAGKIVQQSPLAHAKAPQNAQVLVFLGAYKTA